jgi:hypothetical protein
MTRYYVWGFGVALGALLFLLLPFSMHRTTPLVTVELTGADDTPMARALAICLVEKGREIEHPNPNDPNGVGKLLEACAATERAFILECDSNKRPKGDCLEVKIYLAVTVWRKLFEV